MRPIIIAGIIAPQFVGGYIDGVNLLFFISFVLFYLFISFRSSAEYIGVEWTFLWNFAIILSNFEQFLPLRDIVE